jgi:formylmethanofuran dehydrogenase subunit B
MDGVEVELKKILETENLPDAEILRKIMEAI